MELKPVNPFYHLIALLGGVITGLFLIANYSKDSILKPLVVGSVIGGIVLIFYLLIYPVVFYKKTKLKFEAIGYTIDVACVLVGLLFLFAGLFRPSKTNINEEFYFLLLGAKIYFEVLISLILIRIFLNFSIKKERQRNLSKWERLNKMKFLDVLLFRFPEIKNSK